MTYFYHIPPSAAPIYLKDIYYGLQGFLRIKNYLPKFRRELEEYFHTKNIFLVSSGRAALTIILQALFRISGSIDKNEVLIPAYTCYSVPSAIVKAGLKVRLCDIDPRTLDFDYSLFRDVISERVLAVIPCSLFGIPSDIERLKSIIAGKQIFIIDDAAQAMGASLNDRLAGTRGDIGFFSLDRGKNLTTVEGGIILTDHTDIALGIKRILDNLDGYRKLNQIILLIKAIFISLFVRPFLYWIPAIIPGLGLGETVYSTKFPIRSMSNIQAGLAWNWREKLTTSNMIRKKNARYYYKEFSNLKKVSLIDNNTEGTYHRLPILSDSINNTVVEGLKRYGISRMYPDSINHIPELKFQNKKNFPIAKAVSEKLLCVPTHQYLIEKCRLKLIQQFQKMEKN